MCTGLEIAALAGTALSVGSSVYAAKQRSEQADQEAAYERDDAKQAAENIMRARRRQVGAARAAMAASGTALDSFGEINTNDIQRGAANDEYITLLNGERRARSVTAGNDADQSAAKLNGIGDLLASGYQVGWKGKKKG